MHLSLDQTFVKDIYLCILLLPSTYLIPIKSNPLYFVLQLKVQTDNQKHIVKKPKPIITLYNCE